MKCWARERKPKPKIKKQRISPLLLSGWYPPPGTLPNSNLLERGLGSDALRAGGADADDSIRDRAEVAHAGLVGSQRVGVRRVGGSRRAGDVGQNERIAALVPEESVVSIRQAPVEVGGGALVPKRPGGGKALPSGRRVMKSARVMVRIDATADDSLPPYARVAGRMAIAAMIKMIATTTEVR